MPENIPNIPLIYILNVVNTSVSYFFSYKSALLFVYQKKYIESGIRAVVTLAASVMQIWVLLVTGNYVYYLFIAIGAALIQNGAVFIKADKLYPYLREKKVRPLPEEILWEIRRNVKAMLLHRVGTVAVFSTDNLLISKFAGVATAGLYSNYTMIRGFLNLMITALFDAVTPAMGALTATGTEKDKQEAFCCLNFFSAWLFGWMSICLGCLYDPFIRIWLGDGYLLPRTAVLLIVANFYISAMRTPVINMKSVFGLFWDDRYKAIFEAFINLVVSVALARRWGIAGILAGTFISTAGLPFWVEPAVLYRHGLRQPVTEYFSRYFVYLLVTVAAGGITEALCRTTGQGWGGFLAKTVFCMAVPNLVYLTFYCRTPEFYFFKTALLQRIQK